MRIILSVLGSVVVATGCSTSDDGDDDLDHATDEGSIGKVTVPTVAGPATLTYVVENGHAIHGDDLDLGPVDRLHERGGGANLGERWPDNTVHWTFDDNLFGDVCDAGGVNCRDIRTTVRQILADLALKIPIRFLEHVDPPSSQPHVTLRFGGPFDNPGKASHVGFEGSPDQTITFRQWHAFDGVMGGSYHLEPTSGTLLHEMVHIIGMWHEHQRTDRDSYVEMFWDCIIGGDEAPNFVIREDSADIGLYDFGSIMHYSPKTKCVDDEAPAGCDCVATMAPWDGTTISNADAASRGGLSVEDTNTLHQMYAPGGIQRAGQRFGASLAVGDFDQDGYDDLAVGAPATALRLDAGPMAANAGAVTVYKGTVDGPVFWRTFMQQTMTGEVTTAGAEFGAAVAAYDLDADGIDDLAIGAPGLGAGAVFVWRGSRNRGMVVHRKYTQLGTGADTDTAGDRFGAALAAGPITGMTRTCGSTTLPYEALVVGAPGNTNPSGLKTGAVFAFQEIAVGCRTPSFQVAKGTRVIHEHDNARAGDEFGAVLAVGNLTGGPHPSVFIGAPRNSTSRGAVYRYIGQMPPEPLPVNWSAMLQYQQAASGGANGDEYGSAIAVAVMNADTPAQLAIGAPGNGGAVTIYSAFNVALTTITHPTPAPSDRFGAALGAGPIGGSCCLHTLMIGAPGRNGGDGQVMRVAPASVPVAGALLDQNAGSTGLWLDFETEDRFGAAIAIGNFDGASNRDTTNQVGVRRGDVAVTALGESLEVFGADYANAGAVELLRGGVTTHVPWERMLMPGVPYRL